MIGLDQRFLFWCFYWIIGASWDQWMLSRLPRCATALRCEKKYRAPAQEVFMAHFVYSSQCPAQGGWQKGAIFEELGKSSRALPAPRGETLDGKISYFRWTFDGKMSYFRWTFDGKISYFRWTFDGKMSYFRYLQMWRSFFFGWGWVSKMSLPRSTWDPRKSDSGYVLTLQKGREEVSFISRIYDPWWQWSSTVISYYI